jgi:hypothetical protein
MPNHFFHLLNKVASGAGVGCLVAGAVSGCAVIDQIHSDGTMTHSFALGVPVVIPADPAGQSSVSKVNGFGFTVSNITTTLGWVDETVASLGPDCRVVLIGNTEQQLERFTALLPKKEAVCSDSKLNRGQND